MILPPLAQFRSLTYHQGGDPASTQGWVTDLGVHNFSPREHNAKMPQHSLHPQTPTELHQVHNYTRTNAAGYLVAAESVAKQPGYADIHPLATAWARCDLAFWPWADSKQPGVTPWLTDVQRRTGKPSTKKLWSGRRW